MYVQAIIPTAGLGTRFKAKQPKSLVLLKGRPIIYYALKAFEQSKLVNGIVLVVPKEYLKKFQLIVKKYRFKKVNQIVVGGATRKDSVSNGLSVLDAKTEIVVVHDGARPLVQTKIIDNAIMAAPLAKAVVVAVPVKSTIKTVQKGYVEQTLDRSLLWEIQTPQVFKRDLLVKAHQEFQYTQATDDAMMVESLGVKVKVIEGDYRNIKVTTREDLEIAKTFLR